MERDPGRVLGSDDIPHVEEDRVVSDGHRVDQHRVHPQRHAHIPFAHAVPVPQLPVSLPPGFVFFKNGPVFFVGGIEPIQTRSVSGGGSPVIDPSRPDEFIDDGFIIKVAINRSVAD